MTPKCPTCGCEFESLKGVKQHHATTHGESLNDVRECPFCGEVNKLPHHLPECEEAKAAV